MARAAKERGDNAFLRAMTVNWFSVEIIPWSKMDSVMITEGCKHALIPNSCFLFFVQQILFTGSPI